MKKVIFVVLLVFLILLVLLEGRAAMAGGGEVVVIIGGWGSSEESEQLEYLQKGIPGSVAIISNRRWPLEEAAADVLQQLKQKGLSGKLVLIGHSWGGLIAREIDAENPGMVKKVITIGTPNGGFWFAPRFVSAVRNAETLAPLYAVAGDIGSGTDGVVGTFSALGVKKVKDAKIFPHVSHVGLLQSKEVLGQVLAWLGNP